MIAKTIRTLFISLVLTALMFVPAWASDAEAPLKAWQGEYVSMGFLAQGDEFGPLYASIAQAAEKMGKAYTPEQVKAANLKMYETDFSRMTITENGIVFTPIDGAGAPVTVTYISKGPREAKFGKHTFTWHLFEAASPDSVPDRYRFLLATEKHGHAGGQPHCHLRYGASGFDDLMNNPALENWWPTVVHTDFDTAEFIKGLNPKMMAKMLP